MTTLPVRALLIALAALFAVVELPLPLEPAAALAQDTDEARARRRAARRERALARRRARAERRRRQQQQQARQNGDENEQPAQQRRRPRGQDEEGVQGLVDTTDSPAAAALAPRDGEEAGEDGSTPGAGGDGDNLEFDARVIRGQTAGEGAVILVDREQRPLRPLVRRRRRFLQPTYRAVLGRSHREDGEDE
ncbi:MAG: hypothetical protein ACFCGT_03220 [Sandaracinaceae bacterium]